MGLLTDREKGLLNKDSLEEARKGKIVYLDLTSSSNSALYIVICCKIVSNNCCPFAE